MSETTPDSGEPTEPAAAPPAAASEAPESAALEAAAIEPEVSNDAPGEDAPSAAASSEDAPSTKASSEDAPSTEASSEDAPSAEASSEDAPSEDAPSAEAASEDAPSEDAPSEATPAPGFGAVARAHLKGLIEAMIFVSDKPLGVNDVAKAAKADKKLVRELVDELKAEFQPRGVVLDEVAGGLLFRSNAAYGAFIREAAGKKPVKMSRAQLETLAIVAYRQPLTRPEVDEIRGVDSGAAIKMLLERDLVKILGKKDEPGRPLLYGTTPQFLEFFGLKSLKEMPTLREFTELSDDSKRVYEREIGEEAPGGGFTAASTSFEAGDAAPAPETDPAPAPEAAAEPETATDPETEPALAPEAATEPAPEDELAGEPEPDSAPETDPATVPEPEPAPEATAEPEPDPATDPDPIPEADPDDQSSAGSA